MAGQQNCLLLSQVPNGMVTGLMVIAVDLGLIFQRNPFWPVSQFADI